MVYKLHYLYSQSDDNQYLDNGRFDPTYKPATDLEAHTGPANAYNDQPTHSTDCNRLLRARLHDSRNFQRCWYANFNGWGGGTVYLNHLDCPGTHYVTTHEDYNSISTQISRCKVAWLVHMCNDCGD